MPVLLELHVLGDKVQLPDHLGEDQDPVTPLLAPGQQLVQQPQLPAPLDDGLEPVGVHVAVVQGHGQLAVVTALLEFHHDVHQRLVVT